MKILELRFKNLNSLYGEWLIDFTDYEYTYSGIFALTGPTGSGKSTILDAICLALYGATPRLGKITKSDNEIMSRQSGECYAEVLFESQAGVFRSHWQQRKARKNTKGKLQDPEHQIIDATTCKIIESKKSLVAGVIEEKTGMDFDRFTRSILLVQGGFDTFLKASIEEKSKILEQITGTEIYSKISRRVHEIKRDEQEKLNILKAEISIVEILDSEEEKKIYEEKKIFAKKEHSLNSQISLKNKEVVWLDFIEELKKDILTLETEEQELKRTIVLFKDERLKLESSLKANSLEGLYTKFVTLKKMNKDDSYLLQQKEKSLNFLVTSLNKQEKLLQDTEEISLKATEKLNKETVLIQEVRLLDQKIDEHKKLIDENLSIYNKEKDDLTKAKKIKEKDEENLTSLKESLVEIAQYIKENICDEYLISELAGLEEQLRVLNSKQQEINNQESLLEQESKKIKSFIKELAKINKQYLSKNAEFEELNDKIQQNKETKQQILDDKLLREYRTEKDTLLREIALINQIKSLEEYRQNLESGKACPLCGSTSHPFAKNNTPVVDETEQRIAIVTNIINQVENKDSIITDLEQRKIILSTCINEIEKKNNEVLNTKKHIENNFVERESYIKDNRLQFIALQNRILEKLSPLGIKEIIDITSIIENLRTRLKAWQDNIIAKTKIEQKLVVLHRDMEKNSAVIAEKEKFLSQKKSNLEELHNRNKLNITNRKKLYGAKNVEEEYSNLKKALFDAQKKEKEALIYTTELKEKELVTKTNIINLKERIKQRNSELNKAEQNFLNELIKIGFKDENEFLQARLSTQEQESLSLRNTKLIKQEVELKAKQQERKIRLDKELAKNLTDKTLDNLSVELKELDDCLKEIRNKISNLKFKLNENNLAKERIKQRIDDIDKQNKECQKWEKLHALIGSADGKKYRNFAQGLTFELIVSHANRQLEKMTDRYLLIRDVNQPLSLNVIDNYQAGDIRSSKNLSGGESFIVSLTLALGLSKMTSRKVRVDSLFMDEGFGTLDEESLELALDTLASLKEEGKLIGVISHIPALKERITTQIKIIPSLQGKSKITGPSCKRLA